jgi:hypothetical protein
MKKNYKKVAVVRYWKNEADGECYQYRLTSRNYHRAIQTFQEIRAGIAVWNDEELRDLKVYPRGRRSAKVLDSWNDFAISRNYKKSWKDYTKHEKQWEVGFDPAPRPRVKSPLEIRLELMIDHLTP